MHDSDITSVLIDLVTKYTPNEGANSTCVPVLQLFRESSPHKPKPALYEPYFIFMVQGRKQSVVENREYNYQAGQFLAILAPIPVECQLIEASEEKPLLAVAVRLDRPRMLNILMRMDQIETVQVDHDHLDPSGIFTASMNDDLTDALIRLLRTLSSPDDALIIGENIIDEIYYRILKHEQKGALPALLQQRGQIRQIARALDYIHENLTEVTSVEKLAGIANLSVSAFHRKFKEVMHLSPVQYAKKVKLNRAQEHLLRGANVSEAGYLVGYNSPAQFSREFKRYHGVAPSNVAEDV